MKTTFCAVFAALFFVGCGGPGLTGPSGPTPREVSGGQVAPLPVAGKLDDWEVNEYRSAAVRAQIRVLREEIAATVRAELVTAELVAVELPADEASRFGNLRLFRLLNSPLHERDVFIAPGLFVQSSVFGGRVAASQDATGRITLRFPVALADGLRSEVASGLSSIPLPPFRVIDDQDELRSALASVLGFEPRLRALPGCPRSLAVKFGSDRIPARLVLDQDACPMNQLLEVAVTGTREQARKLIESDMVSGDVRLSGELGLSPQFIRSITSLEFHGPKLRERLYQKFVELPHGVGAGDFLLYPAESVRRGVEEVLSAILRDAGIPALSQGEAAPFVDGVLAIHFEAESCGEGEAPCFRYRAAPLIDEPVVMFDSFGLEKVAVASEPIEVVTRLQGLSNDESRFQVAGENTDDSYPPGRGRKGGLLRPMRDGDLIELELTGLTTSRREYPAPILDPHLSRLDNPVCVRWGEPPVREETDYSNCLEWNHQCSRWLSVCVREEDYCVRGERECVERGVGLCFFCCNRVEFVCHQSGRRCAQTENRCEAWNPTSCKRYGTRTVPAGPAPCVETQNQWIKLWRLSEPPSIVTRPERPETYDRQTLLAGLKLQFTHWEPDLAGRYRQVKATCPLSAFFPEVIQEGTSLKLRLRLANNRDAACEPFNRWNRKPGREPELTLVNQLTRPEEYQCGTREERWNGTVTYSCPKLHRPCAPLEEHFGDVGLGSCSEGGAVSPFPILDTYYPRVAVEGVLRLPGVRFRSVPENQN
jgi:hypothetical protein